MNVELIYDADCPNIAATRSLLIKAFTKIGVSARWKEWERDLPENPEYVQSFGSPTILVNGKDIAEFSSRSGTHACRVYSGGDGTLQPTPPLELICAALLTGAPARKRRIAGEGRWQAIAASFPAIGTALLPKLACPLCLPAYATLLSVLGLEFFDYTPYLLPLTITFLTVALSALVIQARRVRQWAALMISIPASAIVLLGKFAFELDWLTTVGIGLLVVAILIGIGQKPSQITPCPACAAGESEVKAEAR